MYILMVHYVNVHKCIHAESLIVAASATGHGCGNVFLMNDIHVITRYGISIIAVTP